LIFSFIYMNYDVYRQDNGGLIGASRGPAA